VLVYPMLDDRSAQRDHGVRGRFMWTPASNKFGWTSYLGHEPRESDAPEYAAAARREDLSGLAPAWVGVGDLDVLYDESVDYARRLQAAGRSLDVYVQVNTSAEPQKYGLPPEDLEAFLRELPQFSSLRVRGLMTLAIFSSDTERVRECFKLLRGLRDRMRETDPGLIGDGQLSMGMSGDYEVAVEEGATCVRVGQAIFGARSLPDSYYWPGVAGTEHESTSGDGAARSS